MIQKNGCTNDHWLFSLNLQMLKNAVLRMPGDIEFKQINRSTIQKVLLWLAVLLCEAPPKIGLKIDYGQLTVNRLLCFILFLNEDWTSHQVAFHNRFKLI